MRGRALKLRRKFHAGAASEGTTATARRLVTANCRKAFAGIAGRPRLCHLSRKARFDDTLGAIGIEFPSGSHTTASVAERPRDFREGPPGRGDQRPRRDDRGPRRDDRRDRRPMRDHRGPPQRVSTQPVIRGGGGSSKPVSLSELRPRLEGGERRDPRPREERKPQDTAGLRKALEELLKPEPAKEVEVPVATPPGVSQPGEQPSTPIVSEQPKPSNTPIQSPATAPEQKKIQPGEAVKL